MRKLKEKNRRDIIGLFFAKKNLLTDEPRLRLMRKPFLIPLHRSPARRPALGRVAVFSFQIDHEARNFTRTGVKPLACVGDFSCFLLPFAGEQHIMTAIFRVGAEAEVVRVAFFLETDGKMLLLRLGNEYAGRALRKINLLGFAAIHDFDLAVGDGRAAFFVEVAVNREVFGKVKLDSFQVVFRPILVFIKFSVKKSELGRTRTQ